MPLRTIELSELEVVGRGLERPEDVAISRDGRVYATDPHVGAREILPDGSLRSICEIEFPGCCNGISMDLDDRILLANLGAHHNVPGGLERLDPATGKREILLKQVDGQKLTSCNYPLIDRAGNIWCSNSIAAESFDHMATEMAYDGFIFVLRPDGSSSVVADGIGFANGLAMSDDGKWLYCCQSFGANVLRYPVLDGALLGPGDQYGPGFGEAWLPGGAYPAEMHAPDGCAFDVEGNLWVTLYSSHRIVAITPVGDLITILHDPDTRILNGPANVTFGGPDMCDVYIGGLGTKYVVRFRSPVPGMKLAHLI